MARPRKLKFPDEDKPEKTEADPVPPKKRKWKRGGVATRIRIRKAQKGPHPVPRSVMKRMIALEVGDGVRWSPAALDLIIELLHAHVHRTLTITRATMIHAGKKTLTDTHLKFGTILATDMV